ncbi:MAG: hypothetical protein KIS92_13660 [Planctomycetota bacterium]|nr:hypothetical protein [Planctomycetota bacterium]
MPGELPFREIPEAPAQVTGAAVLARMVEGLAFRYRWATEDLRESDAAFKPCESSMSLLELQKHIYGLVAFSAVSLDLGLPEGRPAPDGIESFRLETLEQLQAMAEGLRRMSDVDLAAKKARDLPFWHLINGPIADALTHVGQLNAWRRIHGNPWPGANVFLGKPPKPKP